MSTFASPGKNPGASQLELRILSEETRNPSIPVSLWEQACLTQAQAQAQAQLCSLDGLLFWAAAAAAAAAHFPRGGLAARASQVPQLRIPWLWFLDSQATLPEWLHQMTGSLFFASDFEFIHPIWGRQLASFLTITILSSKIKKHISFVFCI